MSLPVLQNLLTRLELDRSRLGLYDLYYRGRQGRASVSPRLRPASANICRAAVSRVSERLRLDGFATAAGQDVDPELWARWRRLGLEATSRAAHTTALVQGRAYGFAWVDEHGNAQVTCESPWSAYVLHDRATQRPLAGVKVWFETPTDQLPGVAGPYRAVLFSEDSVETWTAFDSDGPGAGWQQVGEAPNPLQAVPIVRLPVGATTTGGPFTPDGQDGQSMLEDLLPLADALDELVDAMAVTAEFYAAPRRYVLGELPTDDQGNVDTLAALSLTAGATWWLESVQSVGTFAPGDLAAFPNAIGQVLQLAAAVTSLPESALGLSHHPNLSGDAVRAQENGLVHRARDAQASLGVGWCRVLALATAIETGQPVSGAEEWIASWMNPETPSSAVITDGVSKAVAAGMPLVTALRNIAGWTEDQLDQLRTDARAAALDSSGVNLTSLLQQPPAPPVLGAA